MTAMSYLDDPRVLFAAERTLLAWNRTAIALMGFGFLVERFGLFLHIVVASPTEPIHRGTSLVLGVAFILLGVALLFYSAWQYRRVVKQLGPGELPTGYHAGFAVLVNLGVGLLGLALAAYLALVTGEQKTAWETQPPAPERSVERPAGSPHGQAPVASIAPSPSPP
jgi:putative membrane protein